MKPSESSRRNLFLFLLVLSLFIGATVEYGHGSIYVGILLFAIAVLIISKVKIDKVSTIKSSKLFAVVGIMIIMFDIVYNYYASDKLGTLDTMTLLLGASLIASNIKNEQARKMGKFCTYMSLSFIILFIFFYSILPALNIKFMSFFDHYFVMLPSVYMCKAIGIPIEAIATAKVRIYGIQDMTVGIGTACSGLYSMFLLISIVIAYALTENIYDKRKILGISIIALVVSYIANLVRVSFIYTVAYMYGYKTMMTVHTHFGWIIFAIVAIVMMYMLSKIERS